MKINLIVLTCVLLFTQSVYAVNNNTDMSEYYKELYNSGKNTNYEKIEYVYVDCQINGFSSAKFEAYPIRKICGEYTKSLYTSKTNRSVFMNLKDYADILYTDPYIRKDSNPNQGTIDHAVGLVKQSHRFGVIRIILEYGDGLFFMEYCNAWSIRNPVECGFSTKALGRFSTRERLIDSLKDLIKDGIDDDLHIKKYAK